MQYLMGACDYKSDIHSEDLQVKSLKDKINTLVNMIEALDKNYGGLLPDDLAFIEDCKRL